MKSIALVLLLLSSPIFAASNEKEIKEVPLRNSRQFGVYASGLGDTVSGLASVNGAYNLTGNLRLTLGVGSVPEWWIGGGTSIKYLFLENNPVTPVVGLGFAAGHFSNHLGKAFDGLFGTPSGAKTEYALAMGNATLGLDWQTRAGFNLGFGVIGSATSSFVFAAPYLNLGWFFR